MNPLRCLLPVLLAAVGPVAAGEPAAEPAPGFWAEREAAYRASPRGPFTAVQAFYVERGEALVLVAGEDSVRAATPADAETAGRPAAWIVWKEDGFHVGAVPGVPGPRAQGEPLTGERLYAQGADDAEDLQIGRFLLSLGAQAEDLGRVVVYDATRLESFGGFPVFEDSDDFRVEATWTPGDQAAVELGTSRGLVKTLSRAAVLSFRIDGEPCTLTGFREAGADGPLFVPYRDATSGAESYGVGRYLRVDPQEDGTAVIDFNRSTNPWCAYSPFYNCILPPAENDLGVAIRAGERAAH